MAQAIGNQGPSSTEVKPIWQRYATLIAAAGVILSAVIGWLNYSKSIQPTDQKAGIVAVGSFNRDSHSEMTYNDFSDRSNRPMLVMPEHVPERPEGKPQTAAPLSVQPAPPASVPAQVRPRVTATPPPAAPAATPEPESPFAFDRDAGLRSYYEKLDDLRVEGAGLAREASSFGECFRTYGEWEAKGIRLLQEINGYIWRGYRKRAFLDQDFSTQDIGFYGLPENTRLSYCRDVFYSRASALGHFDGMIKTALMR